MVDLFNAETDQFIGTITEGDLQVLVDTLEEESSQDRDYYINETTIDLLTGQATDKMVDLLRTALGTSDGVEIRWKLQQ